MYLILFEFVDDRPLIVLADDINSAETIYWENRHQRKCYEYVIRNHEIILIKWRYQL